MKTNRGNNCGSRDLQKHVHKRNQDLSPETFLISSPKRIRKLEYTMISLMFARLFPNSRFMRSLIL